MHRIEVSWVLWENRRSEDPKSKKMQYVMNYSSLQGQVQIHIFGQGSFSPGLGLQRGLMCCACWWGCGVMAATCLQIRAVSRTALTLLLSHLLLWEFLHFADTRAHRGWRKTHRPSLEHVRISATDGRQSPTGSGRPVQPFGGLHPTCGDSSAPLPPRSLSSSG